MKTATGMTLIAIGAILAFAVTAHPPLFNLQVAGWVLMLTGAVGMLMPRRGYGWLRRKLVRRPGPGGPVVSEVEETQYPSYVVLNQGATSRWARGADEPGTMPGFTDPGPADAGPDAGDTAAGSRRDRRG